MSDYRATPAYPGATAGFVYRSPAGYEDPDPYGRRYNQAALAEYGSDYPPNEPAGGAYDSPTTVELDTPASGAVNPDANHFFAVPRGYHCIPCFPDDDTVYPTLHAARAHFDAAHLPDVIEERAATDRAEQTAMQLVATYPFEQILTPLNVIMFCCRVLGCVRQYTDLLTLRKHQRNHIPKEQRPHRCSGCDTRYLYPKDKNNCQAKHAGARLYCPVCNDWAKSFKGNRNDNRARHMRKEHPGVAFPAKDNACFPSVPLPNTPVPSSRASSQRFPSPTPPATPFAQRYPATPSAASSTSAGWSTPSRGEPRPAAHLQPPYHGNSYRQAPTASLSQQPAANIQPPYYTNGYRQTNDPSSPYQQTASSPLADPFLGTSSSSLGATAAFKYRHTSNPNMPQSRQAPATLAQYARSVAGSPYASGGSAPLSRTTSSSGYRSRGASSFPGFSSGRRGSGQSTALTSHSRYSGQDRSYSQVAKDAEASPTPAPGSNSAAKSPDNDGAFGRANVLTRLPIRGRYGDRNHSAVGSRPRG